MISSSRYAAGPRGGSAEFDLGRAVRRSVIRLAVGEPAGAMPAVVVREIEVGIAHSKGRRRSLAVSPWPVESPKFSQGRGSRPAARSAAPAASVGGLLITVLGGNISHGMDPFFSRGRRCLAVRVAGGCGSCDICLAPITGPGRRAVRGPGPSPITSAVTQDAQEESAPFMTRFIRLDISLAGARGSDRGVPARPARARPLRHRRSHPSHARYASRPDHHEDILVPATTPCAPTSTAGGTWPARTNAAARPWPGRRCRTSGLSRRGCAESRTCGSMP